MTPPMRPAAHLLVHTLLLGNQTRSAGLSPVR
jgi:hypothetical protein